MTMHSAFRTISKFAGDAFNSANQFVEQHPVLVGAGLAALGVVLGPEAPAAIGGVLYLMKEAAAISHLHNIQPIKAPSPKLPQDKHAFTPINEETLSRASSSYFTPTDSLEESDATPRPDTVVYAVETPTPNVQKEDEYFDALDGSEKNQSAVVTHSAEQESTAISTSKAFKSKIPVPIKKPIVSVVAPVANEAATTSKVKNKLESFIAAIKETKDVDVLRQLKRLSAFDFQSSRIREKLGSKLGIDLSNINLADSSIQRIRITAGRAMKAA